MADDLNKCIKKSHLRMVEKFNADLEAFRKETGEDAAELYEDANTSFTLADVKVKNGALLYVWNGRQELHVVVLSECGEYIEDEVNGIVEWINFWRQCLNRAKRYWSMDPDRLDKIQDGVIEDEED